MNPMGRPPVLDDIKRHEIYALVTAGYTLKQASEYVDCSVVTINREMSRNPEFARRLGQARASLLLHALSNMRRAAEKNWRAAKWLAEFCMKYQLHDVDPAQPDNLIQQTEIEAREPAKQPFGMIDLYEEQDQFQDDRHYEVELDQQPIASPWDAARVETRTVEQWEPPQEWNAGNDEEQQAEGSRQRAVGEESNEPASCHPFLLPTADSRQPTATSADNRQPTATIHQSAEGSASPHPRPLIPDPQPPRASDRRR